MANMRAFNHAIMRAIGAICRLLHIRKTPASSKVRHQSFAATSSCIAGLLLAGAGPASMPAMAQASPETLGQEPSETLGIDSVASWNLTETKVISKGQVEVLREGEFTHGFILESKATALNPSGSVVPGGTLKLALSAFSPAYDQHGQKKGSWYIGGLWTLTDSTISPSADGKHRAGEISGRIKAELPFNPLVTQKNWTAKAWLPMTRIAPAAQAASSRPARGEGALTMGDKHEGTFLLTLKLWPTMQN